MVILPVGVRRRETGYTLIMVMALVVVLGIVAETAHTLNSHKAKRDREAELLFRGLAIKNAIESYYNAKNDDKLFPPSLKELVSDSRFPYKRHLRKIYREPINGSNWLLVPAIGGGVSGVYIDSDQSPIKRAFFPVELAHLEGSTTYSQWLFEYKPPKKPQLEKPAKQ